MATISFDPEQRQGLIYSVGLHLGIVLLLMMSTQQVNIKPPKGTAIQAEIMDLDDYMKNMTKPSSVQPAPVKKEPPPKPEPKIAEPIKKPPVIEPKPVEKPIEKPVVKSQIDPVKRNEKTERQKKLEEIRRKRQEAEQLANQQPVIKPTEKEPEQQANPVVGTPQGDDNPINKLKGQYALVIDAAVRRQWAMPTSTSKALKCLVKVKQIPGGGVIDVSIGSPCNASSVVKNSIVNAVKKADPLPYTGFEQVFEREIVITFTNTENN